MSHSDKAFVQVRGVQINQLFLSITLISCSLIKYFSSPMSIRF